MQLTARTGLLMMQFRPLRDAPRVKCPALIQICEHDAVAPVAATERAAARMPRAEVVRYPIGHFDVYVGADFERSVRDQLAFLRKHLLAQPT
jgi:pimeloyl-ACP methyl ester carboxylesterase